MLPRIAKKKSLLGLGIKYFIGMEVAMILGSFVLFRRLNGDRDFRYYMYMNWHPCLKMYYGLIKTLTDPDEKLKHEDYRLWGINMLGDGKPGTI